MNHNHRPDPDAGLSWRLRYQLEDFLSHLRTRPGEPYDDVEGAVRSIRLERLYRDTDSQRPRGTWDDHEEVGR
jgi:hypothetical protein